MLMYMTLKKFLNEQRYAFVIAEVAIIFQTVLTASISALLLLTVYDIRYPEFFLKVALLTDSLFVCVHLSYRVLYCGPKISFKRLEKKVLIYHIISSVLALSLTAYIVFRGIDNAFEVMCLALSSWGVSLVTGVLFFYKKYRAFL